MGSSSTAARLAPRAPTSRPTAPGSTTTTSPKGPASPSGTSPRPRRRGYAQGGTAQEGVVRAAGMLDGPAYERWVAGYDVETGQAKGRLRQDAQGLRFVEVVVNGPKTWSLAAACTRRSLPPTTRPRTGPPVRSSAGSPPTPPPGSGPAGRQVQVPVEKLEAAVVRHYTSRAGDPHRHLHLQINARVFAAGAWRGLHSVGVVDSIEAINGIGHAAVMCDPEFRAVLAAHGYTLDPTTGEVAQLAPYAGAFSARAAQITRNIDRYEAQWRSEHPGEQPGPTLRRAWDRRAWSAARPDKVAPVSGDELRAAVGRGAAPARLHSANCRGGAPCCPDRAGQPGRGGRPGALASGGASVGLERRRHPRRGRADHRGRRRRGTGPGTPRAGRGPDRPHRRTVCATAGP